MATYEHRARSTLAAFHNKSIVFAPTFSLHDGLSVHVEYLPSWRSCVVKAVAVLRALALRPFCHKLIDWNTHSSTCSFANDSPHGNPPSAAARSVQLKSISFCGSCIVQRQQWFSQNCNLITVNIAAISGHGENLYESPQNSLGIFLGVRTDP